LVCHIGENNDEDRNKLIVYRIYWDLEEPYEVMTEVDLSGAGLGTDSQAYWPQGFVEIGDFYFVAHMGRELDEGFHQDLGNLYLEIFDKSFNRVDTEQLTFDPAPEGNQRPSLAVQDDILLVTYDKRVSNTLHNYLMEIELNTELIGAGVPNLAPTAYAGADIPGSIGGLVTLDGSGSSDPDGDDLSFGWVFVSVPDSSGLTDEDIVNAYTDAPTFVPDVAGDFEIELTVSDTESSDTDSVLVTAVDNLPPIADAGEGGGISLGESVLLDGALSSDPEGESLMYSWTFSELPEGSSLTDGDIANNDTMLAAFEPDVDGVYVVTLAVSDGVFTADDSVEFSTSGCGCSSSPTPSNTAPWALLMVGLGLFRRRD
jgi:MYXO-CTERM domain-containing protein